MRLIELAFVTHGLEYCMVVDDATRFAEEITLAKCIVKQKWITIRF